jgi:hypothetical protein
MRKKDIRVKIDNGFLLVEGKRKDSTGRGWKFWKKESDFYQNYAFVESRWLDKDMDADKINANMKNDVLTIAIPKKKEHVHFRHIPVSGDSSVEDVKVIGSGRNNWLRNVKTRIVNLVGRTAKVQHFSIINHTFICTLF